MVFKIHPLRLYLQGSYADPAGRLDRSKAGTWRVVGYC
jgi:hypothetical protein